MLSGAYHVALDKKKKHFLSFGLQAGFLQKKLDLANIRLYDQIDLQNEIVNGSNDILNGSDGAFDMQGGFDWSSVFGKRVTVHAGYAAFHLLQPKLSFSNDEQKLPLRHLADV